jgi:hypothetical protein
MSANYTLYLGHHTGYRLGVVEDWIRLEYARHIKRVTPLTIILPGTVSPTLFPFDARLEVWRSVDDGPEYLDTETVWLVRRRQRRITAKGERYLIIQAVSANALARRRIVAYAAGSSQASKSGPADNVMKAVWRENFGSLATDTARDVSAYISTQVDLGLGPTVDLAFARDHVDQVLDDITNNTIQQGTPIYWDVVSPSDGALEFRTYPYRRGLDHRSTSNQAVILSVDNDNLVDVTITEDAEDEVNYVYVGGRGEKDNRAIEPLGDTARMLASALNRAEIFINASQQDLTATQLQNIGRARLELGEPITRFKGTLQNTPSTQYGVHWGFGDQLTAEDGADSYDCTVEAVHVTVEKHGDETIDANIEAEA